MLVSAVLLSSNWLGFIWAVNSDRVLEASLGYFLNPLVSVVLGVTVLGEHLRRGQWVAIVIAAAGVAWLSVDLGSLPWISLCVPGWIWVAGAGLMTSTPLLLFAFAARQIPLWTVGVLQYITPTLQFLLGVLAYDEDWSGGQVAGYSIIWFGLIVFAAEGVARARRVRGSEATEPAI
ncbi:MAG: hypothetical protein EBY65_05885 [Acidimicrobiia bacterium]|nr:hypothetical protein [Acidimicrobiia bacterium]